MVLVSPAPEGSRRINQRRQHYLRRSAKTKTKKRRKRNKTKSGGREVCVFALL